MRVFEDQRLNNIDNTAEVHQSVTRSMFTMVARVNSDIPRKIFKESESLDRYSCVECDSLLQDPVQLSCGHRVCRHCADELIANTETTPQCPECDEEISEEDGAKVKNFCLCN